MSDNLEVEYYYQVSVFIELYDGGLTEELSFNFKTNNEAKDFIRLSVDLPHVESVEGPEVLEMCYTKSTMFAFDELKTQLKCMEVKGLFKAEDEGMFSEAFFRNKED